MNDLERELRNALDREAADTPAPHDAGAAIRRTRRRQAWTIAGSVIAAAALIAIAVVGFGALNDGSGEIVPASTTEEMNGITITFPDGWTLIDPDAWSWR
jgi:ferric-dicitrate binding protein FerR (iron transport regulator)